MGLLLLRSGREIRGSSGVASTGRACLLKATCLVWAATRECQPALTYLRHGRYPRAAGNVNRERQIQRHPPLTLMRLRWSRRGRFGN
jgi:hypothetical protein